jgi:glutamyl-tRNA reductase
MPLFSYGINHQTAPIDIRERLAFNAQQTQTALEEICRLETVNEAVLVSTCNRTEIYISGNKVDTLQRWFRDKAQASNISLESNCYLHSDEAVVKHLLRVASGLDSMVLGEPEILGQIKNAYRLACETGTAGQELQHLFPAIFSASKLIRRETQIGEQPVSLAYAVIQLAKRIFSHLSQCCVLLVGAGELMDLLITYLADHSIQQMIVANRTLEKARSMAESFHGGLGIRIADIPAYLAQADIVITATASQLPLIGKGMLERTVKARKRRPMLIVDLAVPRDVEPEASQLEDIYLYNIDDLQGIIEANLKNRSIAAKQAEALVEIQTAHYMRQLKVSHVGDIISQFRRQAEHHRDQSLQKAFADLQQGRDIHQVIQQLAHQLTNKILHQPTSNLRQLAYHNSAEAVVLAKQLLTTEEI